MTLLAAVGEGAYVGGSFADGTAADVRPDSGAGDGVHHRGHRLGRRQPVAVVVA